MAEIQTKDTNLKSSADATKQRATKKAQNLTNGILNFGKAFSQPFAGSTMTGNSGSTMTGAAANNSSNAMTGNGSNAMTGNGSNAMTGTREVPMRSSMIGAGMNNADIGFNPASGYVTYQGNNFLAPSRIEDGVSYASEDDFNKAMADYFTNQGLSGIRDSLVARGVSSSRIGWNANTGMVTIDGKDAIKPSGIVNGTSYGSASDINALTNLAYRNKGIPIVGATGYAASSGFSNVARWSDGKLTIGGNQVPVVYVDENGKAYAWKNDIDNALEQYKENAGITGNQEVFDNWNSKYGSKINRALNTILNRDEWEYDPYDDPAYLAYRDAYTREGQRAYQNAYAQMAANTGGYGSSASATAAGQQLNYYMQQLDDRIPELMQNSYNRYLSEQQLNREALNSLMNISDSYYNKAYQANRDSISDSNAANYYDYLRDKDARDYNRSVYESDRQWPYQENLLQNQVKNSNYDTDRYEQNADLDLQAKRISNQMNNLKYIIYKYSYAASPDTQISAADAQAIGMSRKADGTYPTIREIQETNARLEALYNDILWKNSGRQQTQETWQINNGLYGG